MSKNHRFTVSMLSLLVFAACAGQAFASKEQNQVDTKQDGSCNDGLLVEKSSAQTARFGQIPINAKTIAIVSESAKVVVKRVAGISEITLASNCPRNWSVKGSMVRQ